MCLKKLFPNWFKPEPILPIPHGNKTALLLAVNDYPGHLNDLNGCLNDQRDVTDKLNKDFSGFDIIKYSDSAVIKGFVISAIERVIELLKSGDHLLIHYSGHGSYTYDVNGDEEDGQDEALYLYDGMLVDDRINEALQKIPDGAIVVILLDSCFSGTATRKVGIKNRFVPNPYLPPRKKTGNRLLRSDNMKWIVISGSGDQQTSADAWIDGEWHGAFTYYCLKALQPGMTYQEWFDKIRTYLPNNDYDQEPELEGNIQLFNRKVFE
jgi:hypothetical protein